MAWGASKIKLDVSVDAMDPDNNAIVDLNKKINREYNSGRPEIFVLYADNVFTPEHLTEIRTITEKLKAVAGVKKVTSLTNSSKIIESEGVLVASEMVPEDNPSEADIIGIRHYLETNYMLKSGILAAKDGTFTSIIVEYGDNADLLTIAAEMEKPVAGIWRGGYDITGMPTLEANLTEIAQQDVKLLLGIAFLIILLMFVLNFRSPLAVFLALLQIIIGLIWGAGSYAWMGMKFQSMTIIAPIAILAVGSSFTLHLLGRYFLELSRGIEKRAAILNVLHRTGLGVFVSGLAISAAMLTFLLSNVSMVRGLGALSALGVGASLISSLTLLPALLNLLPAPKMRVKMENAGILNPGLRALGRWIGHHPKAILGFSAVLLLMASFGISRIVPNTTVIAFFRPDSPILAGMKNIDKAFGGSTSIKMLVDGDFQDPELLKALLAYQEDVRSIPGVGWSTSLASLIRSLHETLTGEPGLPATQDLVAQELLVYQSSGTVDDISSLANLDFTQGVVTFIAPRLSTQETKVLLNKLEERASRIIGTKARVQFAGDIMNETVMEDAIIHDFIISLTLALLLVIAIDSLIRSFRAALVTIIVLVSTIVLQYGVLGYSGLPFNLATSLGGALAIGVGDYAIHLTVRYMEDLGAGLKPKDALIETLSTSGRSIVFTALTLGGGFSALMFSQLMPIALLGGVMILTVVIVGIATLIVLPAACVLFLRNVVPLMEVKEYA
jgi:hypothetical protein